MNPKKFKIALFKGATTLCSDLCILAAEHNGGAKDISIEELRTVAVGAIILYPASNAGIKLRIFENRLLVEKQNGDGENTTLCLIEEVEEINL